MNCPTCNNNVSKTVYKFSLIKTCPFCKCQFLIRYKLKEIFIYSLIIASVCGVAGASFPLASKFVYKLELVQPEDKNNLKDG
ncbi:MAG: hypothetical protein KBD53_05515 [Candidatus Omnitrophica bacterium]|nr:hypothetical protein [Candidatus Omnitrophota bacterium]